MVIQRKKDIAILMICLFFTLAGLYVGSKQILILTIIFGFGIVFQLYKIFIAIPEKNITDGELFIKLNSKGFIEYYDWGFYDEISGKEYRWENITRIVAYKRDLIAYDNIVITCFFNNHNEYIFDEEMPGWNQFRLTLQKNFDFDDEWLSKVTLPAFIRNETVIYQNNNNQF